MVEHDDRAFRPGPANWILTALIGAFGTAVFVVAMVGGRANSAALFVGLPTLLAMALAIRPGRTTDGQVFRATTIALLLGAVLLGEGAICLLLAAPLIYLVVYGTTAIIRWIERPRRMYAVLPVPLLLLASMEGSTDTLRIDPDQSVHVVRLVGLPADEVLSRIASGPRPVPVRSVALRLLRVPLPHHVAGDGLEPGDRWTFGYHRSSHGPGGDTVAMVSQREPGHLTFTFVEDTSITSRWFAWQRADLTWTAVDAGHTVVELTVHYRRALDPAWYFGPLQDALLHQGAGHLLDMLSLR